MKNNWKKALGAVALSALMIGAIATPAAAYEEKGKGQHLIRGRPSVAKQGDTPEATPNADGAKGQIQDRSKGPGAAAVDPCKRPGTQCDPRDSDPSAQSGQSGAAKANPGT